MTERPDGFDELDSLLRPAVDPLLPPPGAFERIRRTAQRRRRARAAAGGATALVVAGAAVSAVYLATPPHTTINGTPAASTSTTATPTPRPTPTATVPSNGPVEPLPSASRAASNVPGTVPESTDTAAPTPSQADSAAAGTPLCATSQLTGSLGQGDAGAGNFYVPLILTNHSSSTCHVKGYPGLSVLDASGNQIGIPATYDSGTNVPIVLAPGASASGTIHTGTGSGTGICEAESTSIRVYPPGNRDALVFPGALKVCDNIFTVTPFAAGTAGNPAG